MFFTLAPTADMRLPFHENMGSTVFSHDSGWQSIDNGWIKGYHSNSHGNWTKITQNQHIVIEHDCYRSYPLWWDSHQRVLTNLLGQGQPIWADQLVSLVNGDLLARPVDLYGDIIVDELSMHNAACIVVENLKIKLQNLLAQHTTLPRRLFVTGGIDTALLYALIRNQQVDCEIVTYEHLEYDKFLDLNLHTIKQQHWAYNQIHHWIEPCVLLTGSCGDEFFMRGPTTVAMWAAWHDINLEQILQSSTGYHRGYFLKPPNIQIFQQHFTQRHEIQQQHPTQQHLIRQILNVNANDHQHWHLGNTLTWTPFKDLEITKIMLRLSVSDLLDQIVDAKFNKYVIEMLWPQALSLISHTKNYNTRENLDVLYTN